MEIEGYELAGEAPYDMGVFNLADKSITPLCYSLNHSERNVQPPFWTIPPFNGLCQLLFHLFKTLVSLISIFYNKLSICIHILQYRNSG
ncbi:hypothetical protein RchiOBHm_Chr4g0438331 [Rosa chinensis]|uniref:Uncharacterized protein n=1 Tax=Rosa chinensis TaxID=74649 RepID=A0A2P6R2I2_ROSCH|nr:hypothetical protein RchiOBHm_Chr4g0438331 [Rosa chinensis]